LLMLSDLEYMQRALQLAERGRGRTAPNPMVGAVVVLPDGTVVGQGFHERAGSPHAEILALQQAGERARGAALYCTLEPCCHQGRTGPCVERIVEAGITRVVAALEDPNPLVSGNGIEHLRRHGVRVEVGVARDLARRLNRPFFMYMQNGRPFVTMKAAVSLDGKVAARPGVRTELTGVESRHHAHAIRAEVDAIAVGSGTVLADDPLLTARVVWRSRPLVRVVFDRRLRVPPAARLFSTLDSGPVVIVTTPEAVVSRRAQELEGAGARLEPIEPGGAGGGLEEAFARLARAGVLSLLLEGGPTLQLAAWRAGLVDAVQLYIAPVALGGEGVPWLDARTFSVSALAERRTRQCGPDLLIEGYVHRTH
jgi:diaminohydroxyphosphoribosylaminopyrimidine deaminase / 5-amino-6-(5-phosphoribosylamino)uracil reductase